MAENRAFAEKYGFDFPLLCDTSRQVGLAYGACDDAGDAHARRITYLIAPDGTIARVFPKVDAAANPEQVLAALA